MASSSRKDGDQTFLDERVQVGQIGGKSDRGISQTMVSEKNEAVFSETVDTKTLASLGKSKRYINLGCEHIPEVDWRLKQIL